MKPVLRVCNWGEWDELDGRRLEGGERLIVQWPNGATTAEVCEVEKGVLHYSDHGHPGTGPNDRAYVAVAFRGVRVRVYLADSGLLCERGVFTGSTATGAPTCNGAA